MAMGQISYLLSSLPPFLCTYLPVYLTTYLPLYLPTHIYESTYSLCLEPT